jgi:hypothetical protein
MIRRVRRPPSIPTWQRSLPFLERSQRLDRRFKRAIAVLTTLAVVGLVVGTSTGRYAAATGALRVRSAVRRVVEPEAMREEKDAEWRLKRRRGIEQTRAVYRDFYDREASPGLRRILSLAGMTPDGVLVRWANYDWTVVLSPKVFQPDDTGRAYRMRPGTRSCWMRAKSLPRRLNSFFFIPDTPEVRRAVADAGASILSESVQTTNSWGLRSPEPDLDAPVRGLVLGDSFMQGIFVNDDDTPPACLERHLRRALASRVAILNTGHIGYSLEQYYHTLLEYFDRFRPQFVLVSICPNDFGDADAVMNGRGGDWSEGAYWLGLIQQFCRTRRVACILSPVPFEMQVVGPRKDGHYPGQVSNISEGPGPYFFNPIEEFTNEHLRLVAERQRDGKRLAMSPLFNGHLNDAHFSALGSALWGHVVGRRIALLLDARSSAAGPGLPAPEPSGER